MQEADARGATLNGGGEERGAGISEKHLGCQAPSGTIPRPRLVGPQSGPDGARLPTVVTNSENILVKEIVCPGEGFPPTPPPFWVSLGTPLFTLFLVTPCIF